MGLSSSRLLYVVLTLCMVVLAFLPNAKATRWLDICVAPARFLGELASPLGWLARGEARAAANALENSIDSELAQSRALAQDERWFALPDEQRLITKRRFVHAQVVRRFSGAPDRIECELEEDAALELVLGLPVVLSNSFVGRVSGIDVESRRLIVHLVTDKEFRVGARSQDFGEAEDPEGTAPGVSMVVGGLASTLRSGTPLVVHNPEHRGSLSGLVRVDEVRDARAPFGELSAGFHLGQLIEASAGRFAVAPEVDLEHGLFRVVVVLPAGATSAPEALDFNVYADENWSNARAYCSGEPASWREGLKIDLSRRAGAREHAAVAAGTRLVGFIERAGALSSDVAMLGDRGVSVPAQARVDDIVAPVVLGRLISLGRERPGGPVRFRWDNVQGLPPTASGETSRRAVVFTGAGELGVPRGLFIGETMLPCSAGEHRIEVVEPVDARLLRELWVWRGIERDTREGAP